MSDLLEATLVRWGLPVGLLGRVPDSELCCDQLLVLSQDLSLVSDPDALHVAGSIWSCYDLWSIHRLSVLLHTPQQFLIQPWCCWSSWWCLLIASLFIYFWFIYIIGKEPCFLCKKKNSKRKDTGGDHPGPEPGPAQAQASWDQVQSSTPARQPEHNATVKGKTPSQNARNRAPVG